MNWKAVAIFCLGMAVGTGPVLGQNSGQQDRAALLARLSQQATAIQQAGALASGKNTANGVPQLGDEAVRIGADVDRQVHQVAEAQGIRLPGALTRESENELKALAPLNGQAFAQRFTAYLENAYPALLDNLHALGNGGDQTLASLADQQAPRIQAQLQAAQQVAEAGGADLPVSPEGQPPLRKHMPATQPPATGNAR